MAMLEILDNVYFWSATALLVLLVIVYRYGRMPILGWLDGEIAKIRTELDQAQKLRAEAANTLAEYQKKQVAAEAEATAILAQAKRDAEQLKLNAEAELKASLARREQQAIDRIAQAEAEALRDVRHAAIDLAMQAAEQVLRQKLDATQSGKLVDQAIADLPQQLARSVSKAA
jgi:F-type H+-transporting ATPase subunit b